MLDDLIYALTIKLNKQILVSNLRLGITKSGIEEYAYYRVLELFENLNLEDYLKYCNNKHKNERDILNNIKGL